MKKLLACIVLVLACLTMTFMACQPIDSSSTEGPATIQDARTFLKAMYKDAATVTPSDYERVAMLSLTGTDGKDYLFPVEWSAVVTTEGAPEGLIKVTKNEDGKAYTIDVDENAQKDYEYTLTATIKNAEGTDSLTFDFKYTLPKFHVSTYAEYVALEKDKAVTIEGIITAITSKTLEDSNNCLYVNDLNNEGGYYVYQMTEDPLTESFDNLNDASKKYALAVGMKVQVRGVKDNYSGTLEIKTPKVTILDAGVTEVTPVDFTEIYKAAAANNDLKAKDLVYKQALLVKISGIEITGQDTDSGYYKFKLDGLESYVRISSSVCPLNKADTEAFKKLHSEKIGNIADVCGVICVYDGAFYLTPVNLNAFSNFTLPPKTPAEQVAFEKETLTVPANITEDGQLDLKNKGTAYTDVTIAWALDKTYPGVTLNKNILTVELQETAQTIKLTATLTNGELSETKDFEVLIDAKETVEYEPVVINAPAAGEYRIVMDTTKLGGGVLYFDGTINSKGALVSTDKANKAASVVVAAVEGKEGVYTLKVGEKYLVGYLNGTYNNLKLADEAGEWTWNDEIKTFVTTFMTVNKNNESYEATFYFGTHSKASSKDTFALSNISYVTGDNAGNVAVSQIVGQFATLQEVEYVPVANKEAVAGEYKIFMDTTALGGGILYFDGTINSRGALVSTDKANKAASVVVAAVEGKEGVYTLKVGEKYLVGYLNGTYNNLKLADEAGEWTWNADIKTFVTTFMTVNKNNESYEATFYFGTHSKASSKDTFALSNISFVTGDNAANIGVTQIVGYFGTMQKKSNVPQPTDEEKLAAIVKKVSTTVTADFDLDSTVTWTVKSGTAIKIENGKAIVTRPAAGTEDATVVLTATLGDATQDVTITVKSMPSETETEEDIVNAAFALKEGESLSDEKTLTGVIVSIVDPYSTQYSNITVDISLYGKTLRCFHMKGDGADTLVVGDKIEVTGTITNYRGIVEFTAGCTFQLIHRHTWDDGKVTKEATCTEKGEKLFTCSECKETKTEAIPAKGHIDENADGKCDVCAAEMSTAESSVVKIEFGKSGTTQESISAYTDTWKATVGSQEWTIVNFNNNKNGWEYIRCGKKSTTGGTASITTTIAEKAIKKIVLNAKFPSSNAQLTSLVVNVKAPDGSAVIETVTLTGCKTGDVEILLKKAFAGCIYEMVFNYDNTTSKNGSIDVLSIDYIG